MSKGDRERWEARYADPISRLKPWQPHDLLVAHALRPGPGARALELACGLGRDALWLAGQGYRVHAVDISLTALQHARAEMLRQGLRVDFICADLDRFPLPKLRYDLVVVFRFLDRRLFPAIRARVRPGGLVIYETLNVGRLDTHPDTNPEHMLARGELPGYFTGWEVIEAADGPRYSRFVGRKPPEE